MTNEKNNVRHMLMQENEILQRYEILKIESKKDHRQLLIVNMLSPFRLNKYHPNGVHIFQWDEATQEWVFKSLHFEANFQLFKHYRENPELWEDRIPHDDEISTIIDTEKKIYDASKDCLLNIGEQRGFKPLAVWMIGGRIFCLSLTLDTQGQPFGFPRLNEVTVAYDPENEKVLLPDNELRTAYDESINEYNVAATKLIGIRGRSQFDKPLFLEIDERHFLAIKSFARTEVLIVHIKLEADQDKEHATVTNIKAENTAFTLVNSRLEMFEPRNSEKHIAREKIQDILGDFTKQLRLTATKG